MSIDGVVESELESLPSELLLSLPSDPESLLNEPESPDEAAPPESPPPSWPRAMAGVPRPAASETAMTAKSARHRPPARRIGAIGPPSAPFSAEGARVCLHP